MARAPFIRKDTPYKLKGRNMNVHFSSFVVISLILFSATAVAEEITQVTTGGGNVTTTVQSSTGTTRITTSGGQSMVTKTKNGTKIEMDSDNSVYTVFADGARVAAPDGVTTLLDGTTITVKDGKRIP